MTPQELNAIKALTNSIRELNSTLSEKSDVSIFVQSEAGMESKAVDIYRQTKSTIARAKVGLEPESQNSLIAETSRESGVQFVTIQGAGSYASAARLTVCVWCGTVTTDNEVDQHRHNTTFHSDRS